MSDPLPFREHVQRYVAMHRIVWEELKKRYPVALDEKLLEQTNSVLATIVIQADRSHAQIDYGELDGLKQYTPDSKPTEAPTPPPNGDGGEEHKRMNPYAITRKRLQDRVLSRKQYAILVALVVEKRKMTPAQHKNIHPEDLARWINDLCEEDLTNYVVAEGLLEVRG